MKNEAAQPIVEVRNLKEYFNINMGMFRTKPLKAVDNVSFAIQPRRNNPVLTLQKR